MKASSYVIAVYGLVLLIGGVIGHQVSGSMASLISSTISSTLLFACCYFIWKKSLIAYDIAMTILGLLFAFFCYRFYATYKIAPAGILVVVTTLVLIYVGRNRPETKRCI